MVHVVITGHGCFLLKTFDYSNLGHSNLLHLLLRLRLGEIDRQHPMVEMSLDILRLIHKG